MRRRASLLLMIVAGCSRSPVEPPAWTANATRSSAPPAASFLTSTDAAPVADVDSQPTAAASGVPLTQPSAPSELTTPPSARPPPVAPAIDPLVAIEPPYKPYERPRPEGIILAAGEDEKLARWNVGGTGDPEFISNRTSFHPGARVVVNTRLIVGKLPQHARRGLSRGGVLAQARSRGYWPLRVCFENALRRSADQHGKTVIRFTVGRSGRVTRAHLRHTDLDGLAGECVRKAVEALTFHPGPSAGLIALDLSVEFWPGDAPVPRARPPEGAETDNPGVLDEEALVSVIAPAVADLEQCYRAGLARDPKLWGRLQVLFELSEDGTVTSMAEDESRFPDRGVRDCALRALRKLSFPAPAEGPLTFVQAFRFGSPPEQAGQATPDSQNAPRE